MTNLLKCSRCGNVIIAETFDSHVCDTLTLERQSHDALWNIKNKNMDGDETLFVKTVEGILFTFSQKVRLAIPTNLGQPFKPTKDGTEPRNENQRLISAIKSEGALLSIHV